MSDRFMKLLCFGGLIGSAALMLVTAWAYSPYWRENTLIINYEFIISAVMVIVVLRLLYVIWMERP